MKEIPLQSSGYSRVNRYPGLWENISSLIPDEKGRTIVSFGCGRGEELLSLSKKFRRASLVGVEREKARIGLARENTADHKNVSIVHTSMFNVENVDCILALSVLCRFPSDVLLPYEAFCEIVSLLTAKLRPGGHFVVLNANYSVLESQSAKELIPLEFPMTWNITVPQYDKDGTKHCEADSRYLFVKKIKK